MLDLILSRGARALPLTTMRQAVLSSSGRFVRAEMLDYFEPLPSRRMALKLRANQVVDDVIRYLGEWEPYVTSLLPSLLIPGSMFFDIGANIGYYSVLGGLIVGDSGEVHAFEPFMPNFQSLIYNVRLNRLTNVTCNRLALDNVGHERVLHVHPKGDFGSTSLGSYVGGKRSSITRTQTLDEYVERNGISEVDLIKIDTEGAEFNILQGAKRLLSKNAKPNIILEVNPLRMGSLGVSTFQLIELLRSHGYSIRRIWPKQDKAVRKILDLEVEGGIDMIALHP